MSETYLVTGSTGFIGSCITRELVRQKKHVSIIVRNKSLNWRLKEISSYLNIYECNLLSQSLEDVVERIKPTYIFHLASYGSLPRENDIERMLDINIKGTLNLINAVKKNKFKLFINAGSSSEYGIKNNKMKESDILEPINDYGVTKATSTLFCQKIAMMESLPIITFRLFSPYGYFEEKSRLVPSVILNALNNDEINVSSPDHVRDFIFIEDVANAYLSSLHCNFPHGAIINIGSGKQHSVAEVVNIILQLTKSGSKVNFGRVKRQERQVEPKVWEADITKAVKVLQWKPKNSLEEGLAKTVEWFRLNKRLYE